MRDFTRIWMSMVPGGWRAWVWKGDQMFTASNLNVGLRKSDDLPGDIRGVRELHGDERKRMLQKVGDE